MHIIVDNDTILGIVNRAKRFVHAIFFVAILVEYAPADLQKLDTVDWAVLEAERLHPVAHIIMRGVRDDVEFDGYELKEGSMVFIAPETAHNIPEVFSNPDKY